MNNNNLTISLQIDVIFNKKITETLRKINESTKYILSGGVLV